MQQMHHLDVGNQQQHHTELLTAQDQQDSSCNACGVCHLACSGYMVVPAVEALAILETALTTTPYLVLFHSITSTPLVPPPLARA